MSKNFIEQLKTTIDFFCRMIIVLIIIVLPIILCIAFTALETLFKTWIYKVTFGL